MSVSTQLVSIIIAAHNRPVLLSKTLDSIEQLHYPNLEIVIIDDGSTIPIQAVIEQWRKASLRAGLSLKTMRQPNSGPASARNTGVQISHGELILFMDDDDFIAPDAVDHLVKAIPDAQGAAIAMGSYRLQYEMQDGGHTGATVAPLEMDSQARLRAMIAGHWFVPIHGYLFTRAAIQRIGPWDCSLSSQEDDELLLRAALAGLLFLRAPNALAYYRQHDGARRATPGKRDESALLGRIKRLHSDIAIREYTYRQLHQSGLLPSYRDAFLSWRKRLAERYGDLFNTEQARLKDSAVLNWLKNPFNTLDTSIRVRQAPAGWQPGPMRGKSHVEQPFSAGSRARARAIGRSMRQSRSDQANSRLFRQDKEPDGRK